MYSVAEEQKLMAVCESISNEPIEDHSFNVIRNPKPVCESFTGFGDLAPEYKAKVGTVKPKSEKCGKTDTKEVTKNVTVEDKKEDGQIVEVETTTGVVETKDEPKPKKKDFDGAAKASMTSNKSGAENKKKFDDSCKKQKNLEMFKQFCTKITKIDPSSKAAVESVLAKVQANIDNLRAK